MDERDCASTSLVAWMLRRRPMLRMSGDWERCTEGMPPSSCAPGTWNWELRGGRDCWGVMEESRFPAPPAATAVALGSWQELRAPRGEVQASGPLLLMPLSGPSSSPLPRTPFSSPQAPELALLAPARSAPPRPSRSSPPQLNPDTSCSPFGVCIMSTMSMTCSAMRKACARRTCGMWRCVRG
eukprot:1157465-Pelagomonas_calceolata.AAC.2